MDLQRAWLGRGPLAWLLWPVSLIFGALAALRRWLFRIGVLRTERVDVPVLVVGNVIAGGSGKTPVVIALVRHLRAQGLEVGVISRGYGRKTRDCREVLPGADPRDVGDEAALTHQLTGVPVFVAARRIEAARALLQRHPQTRLIVSDDGLQHLALARDIELCVFDDRGIGNRWLLPAGPLREHWPRRCDLVLHTGARPAFAEGFRSQRTLADHALRSDGSRVSLAELAGKPVVALAAIAKPEGFFAMLRARGIQPERCIPLPDHFDFEDWRRPPGGHFLLCTEKDAVKLWHVAPEALAVPLVFTPEPAFFAALDAKLSSLDGHQAA
ncbi:tetraacyldisaccharide 4'-kinase [Variovorax rhizosphaerae]|uniref:Tetraacyldisaccharide 4'-kinase n=1 Tax=Variovorax rhizosphaerae TaxID=1836200 RepID=A0ABU8WKR5_9BURK